MLLNLFCILLGRLAVSLPSPLHHGHSYNKHDHLSPENISYLDQVGIRDRCKGKRQIIDHITIVVSARNLNSIEPNGWIQHMGLPWTAVLVQLPAEQVPENWQHNVQKLSNNFMKEGSGYLEFILAHWNCLPTVTAFIHTHREAYVHYTYADETQYINFRNAAQKEKNYASPTHFHDDFQDVLNRLCWEKVETYLPLLNCSSTNPQDHPVFPHALELLKRFAPYNLQYSMTKYGLLYFCCGSFAVHRSSILQKGKQWWVDLYKYAKELDTKVNSLLAAYIMEISWATLLADPMFLARMETNLEELWRLHGWSLKWNPALPKLPTLSLSLLNETKRRAALLPPLVVSDWFTCGPRSSFVWHQHKKERIHRARTRFEHFERRGRFNNISLTSSEGTCARFLGTGGQVQQWRLWKREFCEQSLEARYDPIDIKRQGWQWDPKGLGECTPPQKYALGVTYSVVPKHLPVCTCLDNCKQDYPVCCQIGEQTCRPCPTP
eukprot:g43584.t1